MAGRLSRASWRTGPRGPRLHPRDDRALGLAQLQRGRTARWSAARRSWCGMPSSRSRTPKPPTRHCRPSAPEGAANSHPAPLPRYTGKMSSKFFFPSGSSGCEVPLAMPLRPGDDRRNRGKRVRLCVCSCGSSVQAPTLLEIVALEPAPVETQPQPKAPSWGAWHRVMLVGFIFALAAIGMAIWMSVVPPRVAVCVRAGRDRASGTKHVPRPLTWENWLAVKQGLDRRTDTEYPPAAFHLSHEGRCRRRLGAGRHRLDRHRPPREKSRAGRVARPRMSGSARRHTPFCGQDGFPNPT